jgi:hypothetical protein
VYLARGSSTKVYKVTRLPLQRYHSHQQLPHHSNHNQHQTSTFRTFFKMVSFTAAALSSLAAAGLVQFAPAPFAAIPVAITINIGTAAAWAGAAGGIAGGATGVASAIQNSKKRSVGSESWTKMRR